MLSVADALNLVLAESPQGREETVPLTKSLGRVLADDLLTPHDSPPFHKSLMDGFAISTLAATAGDMARLTVVETVTAGKIPTQNVTQTTAVRIMTGAALPQDCDCVVPIELTQFDESNPGSVGIPREAIIPEANLMRQGGAAMKDSVLLAKGTQLQPQQIAALAEFGKAKLSVFRRPSVAVLATGDELIPFDQPLRHGAIRNSNEPMLLAQATVCGAHAVSCGVAGDNVEDLSAGIQKGLQHDVLILSGGVSAGQLDLVPQQLTEAGVEKVFHGVDMKPGKPLWFGIRRHESRTTLVFGLPGNPVSSLVCFELFVRPALEKLSGLSGSRNAGMLGRLMEPFTAKGSRPIYQPVAISIQDGCVVVRPVPWSGSSDLRATVEANGMALLSAARGPYAGGETIPVWLWGGSCFGS